MLPLVTIVSLLLCGVQKASSHGRLLEPPSRASMWRMGFNTPENFDDDQTYCGGWGVQWNENRGRCGICGDPWNDFPKEHEAPFGKYATGTIVRRYTSGSWIPVIVDITTNHGGYFSFKLCPNNDISQDPDQRCFDEYILQTGKNGATEQLLSTDLSGPTTLYVKLPENITCSQCIIQWTWIVANNWGSCHNGARGVGCGPQETFRSCSDISISKKQIRSKTKVEKMEMLKKLYYIIKKREKEKSSMLTRLKLLKLKREMILKREAIAREKSSEKTTQRVGARHIAIEDLRSNGFVKLHKELEHDADNDEIKKKNAKRNDIKDTRKKRKTERTASEPLNNKERSQSLLRRDNLYKSMLWPKVQQRNLINSTNTDPARLENLLPKGTTSRSNIENHIHNRRKNPHINNQLSRPQIGADDLKNYLQVNPNDLPSEPEKSKSERNLNIIRILLARKIENLRSKIIEENKNIEALESKKQDKVQSDENISDIEEDISEVESDNVRQSDELDEVKDKFEKHKLKSEKPAKKMLVLPWWMRIIVQDKNKTQ